MSDGVRKPRIAVVIPSFRVARHIGGVLAGIGDFVDAIYVVDDACPEGSGDWVERHVSDQRVTVLRHTFNRGVGGAVLTGYRKAIDDGAEVIVKIDGDGQMDAALIPFLVEPIVSGEADYTKGNRFFDLAQIERMPKVRIFGNAVLSFMSKLSCGYWDIFDPTNGFTAIHARTANILPFDKISSRYFFETDMLFRLNTFRAVVVDVPMDARYGEEVSGLKISRIFGEFIFKHARNLAKRLVYNYVLRDLSIATFELLVGTALLLFGVGFGAWHWHLSLASGAPSPLGTVMIPTLSVLLGIQLVLAFLAYDIASVPRRAIHRRLR